MHLVTYLCRAVALISLIMLSACSGGSTDNQASTTVLADGLTFSVISPDVSTPAAQVITATFSTGTLYITVLHSGTAIENVSYTLSGAKAQVVVTPKSPSKLGVGIFSGVVTITGYRCADASCSGQVSGNSQAINVTYLIPPIVRQVAPYVGNSNMAESVIIRGQGFTKFSITNVKFGSTVASSFTVINDNVIQTTHPALLAGTYAVEIEAPTAPMAITSSANLVVVNAPNYIATTVAYPPTAPAPQVTQLLYDAERQALLVAINPSIAGSQILRFPFASGTTWGPSSSVAIDSLSDIALSTNGQNLFVLSQTTLTEADPATLALDPNIPGPSLTSGIFLKNLGIINDGAALVTTGYNSSLGTSLYFYNPSNTVFSVLTATSLDNAIPGISADGSLSVFQGGNSGLTYPTTVYQYTADTSLFSSFGILLNKNSVTPVLDRTATRVVLNGTNVYDNLHNLLGTLPNTALAVVLNSDPVDSRAYTFDSADSKLHSFDLSNSVFGGAYPEVGLGTVLAGNPGTGIKMAISPDGGTVFLAGSDMIVVQPSPP